AKVMAEHLGLHTVGDLLHHSPRRYEERGQLTHLADLPMDEHVTGVARVADARLHSFASCRAPRGRGPRREVTITDGHGRLPLRCARDRPPPARAAAYSRAPPRSCCAAPQPRRRRPGPPRSSPSTRRPPSGGPGRSASPAGRCAPAPTRPGARSPQPSVTAAG